MSNTLVLEKVTFGRMSGLYRVYDSEKPDKTLTYTAKSAFPEFFDHQIIEPLADKSWEKIEVYEGKAGESEHYTVELDRQYKADYAKELIAKLYAVISGQTKWVAEDVVDEVQTCITEAFQVDGYGAEQAYAVLSGYLGLDASYMWIFRED